MLVAAIRMASCTTVATDDSTAPATAGFINAGSSFARVPMAPMVALLETKPEARPASGRP